MISTDFFVELKSKLGKKGGKIASDRILVELGGNQLILECQIFAQ